MKWFVKNRTSLLPTRRFFFAVPFNFFYVNTLLGIEYGDDVMNSAVAVYNKFSNFIFDCNDYIKGVKPLGSFDESTLFQVNSATFFFHLPIQFI